MRKRKGGPGAALDEARAALSPDQQRLLDRIMADSEKDARRPNHQSNTWRKSGGDVVGTLLEEHEGYVRTSRHYEKIFK